MNKRITIALLALFFIFSYSCKKVEEFIDPNTGDETTELYEGDFNVLTLGEQTGNYTYDQFTCFIKAEDGTIFSRVGTHERIDDESILTFDVGIAEGIYRLLYLQNEVSVKDSDEVYYEEYGLGCQIEFSSDGEFTVLSRYNATLGLSSDYTSSNGPYTISSYDHLRILRALVNTAGTNELITNEVCFYQDGDINLHYGS